MHEYSKQYLLVVVSQMSLRISLHKHNPSYVKVLESYPNLGVAEETYYERDVLWEETLHDWLP